MVKVKFTLDRQTEEQTGWFLYTPQTSFAGGGGGCVYKKRVEVWRGTLGCVVYQLAFKVFGRWKLFAQVFWNQPEFL